MNSKEIDITSLPVFYINLDMRVDRKDRVEKVLSGNNFSNVNRFPGVNSRKKFQGGKRIGCSMSHINVLRHIVENNIYPSLVLEDDIDVFSFRKNISIPEKIDAMYLGISRYGSSSEKPFPSRLEVSELNKEFHKVNNMLTRHAVVHFSPDYDLHCIEVMEDFVKDPSNNVSGDTAISKINPQHNVYCQNVPVFYQNDMPRRTLTKCSLYDFEYIDLDFASNRDKIGV
jgi:hypothetical protein